MTRSQVRDVSCMNNAGKKNHHVSSPHFFFFLFNVSAKQFPSVKWLFPLVLSADARARLFHPRRRAMGFCPAAALRRREEGLRGGLQGLHEGPRLLRGEPRLRPGDCTAVGQILQRDGSPSSPCGEGAGAVPDLGEDHTSEADARGGLAHGAVAPPACGQSRRAAAKGLRRVNC